MVARLVFIVLQGAIVALATYVLAMAFELSFAQALTIWALVLVTVLGIDTLRRLDK